MNLPRTISVIDTGADSSSVMVWLRRSSAIMRIASSGTANSSIAAAVAKVGAATSSVTPGGLAQLRQLRLDLQEIVEALQETVAEDDLHDGQHQPRQRRGEQRAQFLAGDGENHDVRFRFLRVSCTNTSSRLVCAGVSW